MKKLMSLWNVKLDGKTVLMAAFLVVLFAVLVVHPQAYVFAETEDVSNVVTEKFGVLLSLVEGIVSSIGMIITLWGLSEWGIAFQGSEGTMQANAFKRIGGGIVMSLAPQILPIFVG